MNNNRILKEWLDASGKKISINNMSQSAYTGHYCYECGEKLEDDKYDDGYRKGPDNELYCDDCWDELFFVCRGCKRILDKEEATELGFGNLYCPTCANED